MRERNGPFAGKKTNRPVASYEGCHTRAVTFLSSGIPGNETRRMRALLKGREIFMEGMLLEKAMERGLTLPYKYVYYEESCHFQASRFSQFCFTSGVAT